MNTFNLLYTVITIAAVLGVILGTCAVLIFVERRIAAAVQDRCGPNRVGPWGLLQSVADGLKFLLKEDIIPNHVDKFLYLLAPCLAVSTALFAFAVIPFGQTSTQAEQYSYEFVIAPNVDIGILFVFAISSLNVYGVILGGWAANNKYSMMGALRSSAQIISYEIPLGLSIVGVLLLTGSLNLERVIEYQVVGGGVWNILIQPLAFLLFLVSVFAETNRLPFDLAEAEQELIGGFHTEYSSLKFALFFLGEYTHMITASFLMVTLFFGGWHFPFIAGPHSFWLVKLIVFAVKVSFFIVFFMLIRWTIPRFRFDQLMGLAWKVMIPLSLANVVCAMFIREFNLTPWLLLPISIVLFVGAGFLTVGSPSKPKQKQPVSANGELVAST